MTFHDEHATYFAGLNQERKMSHVPQGASYRAEGRTYLEPEFQLFQRFRVLKRLAFWKSNSAA